MRKLIMFLIASFYLLSCSQKEPVDLDQGSGSSTTLHSGARTTQVYDFGTRSYTTIYETDPTIINNFQHWWQNHETSVALLGKDNAAVSCASTVHMMIANCFARSKGLIYGANAKKQKQIFDYAGPLASISKINDYITLYDKSFLTKQLYNTIPATDAGRTEFKTTCETILANNGIILAGVNAYVGTDAKLLVHTEPYYSTGVTTNPDLDVIGGQKYITNESNGTSSKAIVDKKSVTYTVGGHVIAVIAITKYANGNGIVTYIDPISMSHSPSNRKYMTYKRFLDSNNANVKNKSYYQCLAIYRK